MNLWESLLDVLEEQTKAYLQLGKLMESKQKSIMENSLTDLEKAVAKESVLAKHLNLLEEKRMEVIGDLLKELALDRQEITLSELSKYLPAKYDSYYNKLRTQLKDAVDKAATLNKINQELLEASLAYVNYSLNLMTGIQSSGSYGQQGQEQENKELKRSLFDQKV